MVTENELETLDLAKFQVIFLCNMYRLNEKPLEELRKWVENGGGLVIMPGEQVDEQYFNEHLYGLGEQEGRGLSPVRLESIHGDETERVWSGFKIEDEQHPILSEFAGQQNPLLHSVKVFRFWKMIAKPIPNMAPPQILARLTDAEESLAMVERPFGKGRVIITSVPADADWTSWTSDPSYILTMQLMVRYLTTGDTREALLRVGEPLRKVIDLSQVELDAELVLPGEKKTHLQATQIKPEEGKPQETNRWLLEQKQTAAQGFYELKLANRTGGGEGVLYAANVDPAEGDLRRANTTEMERQLRDVGVRFMSGVGSGMGGIGAQVEIWKYLLWLLVALLLGEQVLGWFFGLRR